MLGAFCLIRSELVGTYQTGIESLEKRFLYSKSLDIGHFTLNVFSDFGIEANNGFWLFGSCLYKGKKDEEAVKEVLNNPSVTWDDVKGNYAIITKNQSGFSLILDTLRKYHLFSLNDGAFLSNSFISCCEGAEYLTINDRAAYEKLARGYIMAPDTLFNEIKVVGPEERIASDINLIQNGFQKKESPKYKDRKAAIQAQKDRLIQYFEEKRNFFEEEGIDLGISSGYDSRLLLALMRKIGLKNVQLHTHGIKGLPVHSFDRRIAERLSQLSGYPLKVVETSKFTDLTGTDLDCAIEENFQTFEGRNAHNMGAFTETYTLSYKRRVLGNQAISLNGLGGEIYRNYYNISKSFSPSYFIENHLFYRFAKDLIREPNFHDLKEYFIERVNSQLQAAPKEDSERQWVRRYYSEIRMPQGDAANHNAYNAHLHFMTPFIEPDILNLAYGVDDFLGIGGRFEGELIASIDKELAAVPTHYGKNAINPGPKAILSDSLKAYLPQFFWRKKLDWQKSSTGFSDKNKRFLNHLQIESQFFNSAWNNLKILFPEIEWKAVYYEFACLVNAAMIAVTFERYKNKISRK